MRGAACGVGRGHLVGRNKSLTVQVHGAGLPLRAVSNNAA
jgi:hypothetical protein